MFKVIFGDNDGVLEVIKNEFSGAYSEKVEAILVTNDEYQKIEDKYHFESDEYDDENDEIGSISVSTLNDYLEMMWEQETIEIPVTFVYPDKIEIQLNNDVEIALQVYEDKDYSKQKEEVDELLNSKDWYEKLYKETVIIMLELVLNDVRNQIKLLSEGDK